MKRKIICTLGPSSFNKSVLLNLKKIGVDIFRINMSHTSISELENLIIYLKKNKIRNICIDTEGAQIRTTKVKNKIFFKKKQTVKIANFQKYSSKNIINVYPNIDLTKIKSGSVIQIGFDNLEMKVKRKHLIQNYITCTVVSEGYLESNKGVHISRNLNLSPLTEKDLQAIRIARKHNIMFYAMSFVNRGSDIDRLKENIPKNSFIISKIETKNSLKNISKISKRSNALLIDRGDLSRYIPIHQIPVIQEGIAKLAKQIKIPLYVATNLLETMIKENNPTRAESHDIFSTFNQGVQGFVLAAETAIGKDPVECVKFLKKCLINFEKKNVKKLQKIIK